MVDFPSLEPQPLDHVLVLPAVQSVGHAMSLNGHTMANLDGQLSVVHSLLAVGR